MDEAPLLNLSLLGKCTLLSGLIFSVWAQFIQEGAAHLINLLPTQSSLRDELSTSTLVCMHPAYQLYWGNFHESKTQPVPSTARVLTSGSRSPRKSSEIRYRMLCEGDLFSLGPTGFPQGLQRRGRTQATEQRGHCGCSPQPWSRPVPDPHTVCKHHGVNKLYASLPAWFLQIVILNVPKARLIFGLNTYWLHGFLGSLFLWVVKSCFSKRQGNHLQPENSWDSALQQLCQFQAG